MDFTFQQYKNSKNAPVSAPARVPATNARRNIDSSATGAQPELQPLQVVIPTEFQKQSSSEMG